MSTHIEDATSISFRIDHLTACVNQLSSDIMSREKVVFEKYAVLEFHIICIYLYFLENSVSLA